MRRPRQRPLFLASAAFLLADSLGCILLLGAPDLLAPIFPSASAKDLEAPAGALLGFIVGAGTALAYLLPEQAFLLLTQEHSAGRLVASGPTATYWHRPGRWVAAGLLWSALAGIYFGALACLEAGGSAAILTWGGARIAAYGVVVLAGFRAIRIARKAERAA